MSPKKIDRPLLITVIILMVIGFIIFCSASLGLLARNGATFSSVAVNQLFFGIILGGLSCFIFSHINYKHLKKYSFYVFIFSIILTCLVFVPHIGFQHGGAKRWISLGSFSFQPSELLKLAYVIYIAAWLSRIKQGVKDFKEGTLLFMIFSGVVGIIMLLQPDTATFEVMFMAGLTMFVVAGARWRDLGIMFLIGLVTLSVLFVTRPYVRARVMTFINPEDNALTSGYQAQQSLIAVGSGKMLGRGFGQSIQKFNFLPEPIGDSIFAVQAEEFGFVGSITLIFLYVYFALRGYKVAARIPDSFGALLAVGLTTLIITQSFINIASMLGLMPLSGIPLSFVSHGGTALLFTLVSVGILFNISKHQKVTVE